MKVTVIWPDGIQHTKIVKTQREVNALISAFGDRNFISQSNREVKIVVED
jgi:hypothetical protein